MFTKSFKFKFKTFLEGNYSKNFRVNAAIVFSCYSTVRVITIDKRPVFIE